MSNDETIEAVKRHEKEWARLLSRRSKLLWRKIQIEREIAEVESGMADASKASAEAKARLTGGAS